MEYTYNLIGTCLRLLRTWVCTRYIVSKKIRNVKGGGLCTLYSGYIHELISLSAPRTKASRVTSIPPAEIQVGM